MPWTRFGFMLTQAWCMILHLTAFTFFFNWWERKRSWNSFCPEQTRLSNARVNTRSPPMKSLERHSNYLLKRTAQVVGRLQPYSSARSSKARLSKAGVRAVCPSVCPSRRKTAGLQQQNRDGAVRIKFFFQLSGARSEPPPSWLRVLCLTTQLSSFG